MVEPSADGRRLTAHLEPGGPCLAVAEHQPDDRWLVNGRTMSHEHAVVVLEAAVTVAAASRLPHSSQNLPPQPATHPTRSRAGTPATTGHVITRTRRPDGDPAPGEHQRLPNVGLAWAECAVGLAQAG
jgi:hypothetical protein